MTTTKYVARLDGKIIGKRSTKARKYSHALVVQHIEDVACQVAYNRSAEWQKLDRKNFNYICEKAAAGIDHPHYWGDDAKRTNEHAADAAVAAAGLEAYIEARRQEAITSFERRKANGGFQPFVATWCGRPDLAQKAISTFTGPACRFVAIVAAEIV